MGTYFRNFKLKCIECVENYYNVLNEDILRGRTCETCQKSQRDKWPKDKN